MPNLNIICYFALTQCTEYYHLSEDSQKIMTRDVEIETSKQVSLEICIGVLYLKNF